MVGSNSSSRERVYRFVIERLLQGETPSVREVQHALGFRAVQSAKEHLDALVAEGRLARMAGIARNLRLPASSKLGRHPTQMVPLLGRVQAGVLTTAVQESDEHVLVESRFAPEELFALRVRGESMTLAGIFPNDVVIVRRQPTAATGDIVVALVGDEATVKRLRLRRRQIELVPENPAFEPIVVKPNDLVLLGKVIEVRRYLDSDSR